MLELEGKLAGYFTECSGIGSEHEVIEHKVVDDQGHELVRKIPGRLKWEDVTLKRGITSDLTIWEWRQNVVVGKMSDARKNCSIIMIGPDYATEVAVWHFRQRLAFQGNGPQSQVRQQRVRHRRSDDRARGYVARIVKQYVSLRVNA